MDLLAVKYNGSDVNPGICVPVNTRSYRYTENISLDGVTRQIPGLTSLPLTLTAKRFTIYYKFVKFPHDIGTLRFKVQ